MIIHDLFENKTVTNQQGVAEGAEPTEKVSAVIKRVLGPALTWEPGHSKMYKNTRRSRTQRVDDYVMMGVELNTKFAGKMYLSANDGDPLAVNLKKALIQAGYPVYNDLLVFDNQIMFQVRKPITTTAESGVAEAIVGKPKYSEPHQSGRGFYSAADYMVRTKHQLGSHVYTAVTQVDADNDRYYFIYQKGNKEPVFYATDMGRFEVRTDKLGNRISNAIITAHRKATDHDLEKYISGDDEQGVAEGSVTKKPQPYNDPNWIKNLPKEKLDALAGPRYHKKDKKQQGVAEAQQVEEMDKSQDPPGRDGGHQFEPGPKVSKKVIKAVKKDPAKHLSDLFAKEYSNKKVKEQGVSEGRPDVMRHTGDKTVRVVRRGGKPIGEIGIDAEASPGQGQYYVKLYDGSVDLSGYDTAQEALDDLKSALNEETPVPTAMGGTSAANAAPAAPAGDTATAPAQSQAQSAALATAQQQQQKREMQDEIKNKQGEISQLQKSMVSV